MTVATLEPRPTIAPLRVQKGSHRKESTSLQNATELQRLIMARARNPKTTDVALAQIARAWCELEERKRILRMKPKPKDIDVDAFALAKRLRAQRSKQLSEGFVELDATPAAGPTKETAPLETEPKESLLPTQGVTAGPPGKGENGDRELSDTPPT